MNIFTTALLVAIALANPRNKIRITGGQSAKSLQYPYFVNLDIEFERGTRTCGGLLGVPEDRVYSCVIE